MARTRMVTRTVKATIANVLCANAETGECFNQEYILTGKFNSDKEMNKAIDNAETDENIVRVKVVDVAVEEQLYGMPETEFIKYAKPITKEQATDAEA